MLMFVDSNQIFYAWGLTLEIDLLILVYKHLNIGQLVYESVNSFSSSKLAYKVEYQVKTLNAISP